MTSPKRPRDGGARRSLIRRLRPEAVLLIGILVGIALFPVVLILSCSDGTREDWSGGPKERITFDDQPRVRVSLAPHTRGGTTMPTIRVTGPYTLQDPTTGTIYASGHRLDRSPVIALSKGVVIRVPDAAGVLANRHLPRLRIVPSNVGTLHVGRYRYRGVLDLVYNRSDATMTVVNEIGLDEYVGGVVAAELLPKWRVPAVLRAQAVVARTYTLALVMENRNKHPRPETDVTARFLTSQAYHGMNGERADILEAVRITRGEVLTHRGDVFRAYYSSCCGGHTEACGAVWDDYATIEPLAGTACPYCDISPHANWTKTLKLSDIETALRRKGRDVGTVREVTFADTTNSGHNDKVTVRGSKRTITMLGNNFRLAIGSTTLKSMYFKAEPSEDGYTLTGHGWGHGVGMCQWGAYVMSLRLHNYKQILKHYYPGSTLTEVY